jgi:hypothetical protein
MPPVTISNAMHHGSHSTSAHFSRQLHCYSSDTLPAAPVPVAAKVGHASWPGVQCWAAPNQSALVHDMPAGSLPSTTRASGMWRRSCGASRCRSVTVGRKRTSNSRAVKAVPSRQLQAVLWVAQHVCSAAAGTCPELPGGQERWTAAVRSTCLPCAWFLLHSHTHPSLRITWCGAHQAVAATNRRKQQRAFLAERSIMMLWCHAVLAVAAGEADS